VTDEPQQPVQPFLGLDDMLDEQIVPGFGESGQASVKSVEKRLAQVAHRKFAALNASLRQHLGGDQMVDREMPERQDESRLQSPRQRGLPRARRTVQKDYLAGQSAALVIRTAGRRSPSDMAMSYRSTAA
jgi:hypothetical protein